MPECLSVPTSSGITDLFGLHTYTDCIRIQTRFNPQVTRQLRMDGWPALSIHGDKSQQERDWVLAEFKQNKSPIMLATDVAARGLGRTEPPNCMEHHSLLTQPQLHMCTAVHT